MPLTAIAKDDFASLQPPPAATAELDAARNADACKALEGTVAAYLHNRWRVIDRRCFLLETKMDWISTEKLLDNRLAPQGAKRRTFDWHETGSDQVAVWKFGWLKPEYLAVAMAANRVEGQPLVGYFSIEPAGD
jgi:hypothetical protein